MNQEERKAYIASKLREAGKSGTNLHVISTLMGKWSVFSEGSDKMRYTSVNRLQAVLKAKELMERGHADAIVLHKEDGSVESIEPRHTPKEAV